jgi:neutral ceramidase
MVLFHVLRPPSSRDLVAGPNTLVGFQQEFGRLAADMAAGTPSATAPAPEDLSDLQISLHAPGVPFDRVPLGAKFGQVVDGKDVLSSYKVGDTARVTFHGANPRNDKKVQGTYLTVERKTDSKVPHFETVAVDGDWSTKFEWEAGKEDPLDLGLSAQSKTTISWTIPSSAQSGTYRICYFGNNKRKDESIHAFTGCSSEFTV